MVDNSYETGRAFYEVSMPRGEKTKKNPIFHFESLTHASKELGIPISTLYNRLLRNKHITYKEFTAPAPLKHNLSGTPLHLVWKGIKNRCDNPHSTFYKRYGGRGITICDEWKKFINFYHWALANGYKSGLTIDRIDNDGNYCPANCRWVTIKENCNNQSRTVWVMCPDNIKRPVSQAAELFCIDYQLLSVRVRRCPNATTEYLFTNTRHSPIKCEGKTLKQISAETGLHKETLLRRIRKNPKITLKELSQPAKTRPHRPKEQDYH